MVEIYKKKHLISPAEKVNKRYYYYWLKMHFHRVILHVVGPKKQVTDKARETVSVGSQEVESYRLWYAVCGPCQVTFDPLRTLGILSRQDSMRWNKRRRKRRGIPEYLTKTRDGFHFGSSYWSTKDRQTSMLTNQTFYRSSSFSD